LSEVRSTEMKRGRVAQRKRPKNRNSGTVFEKGASPRDAPQELLRMCKVQHCHGADDFDLLVELRGTILLGVETRSVGGGRTADQNTMGPWAPCAQGSDSESKKKGGAIRKVKRRAISGLGWGVCP